MDVREKRDWLLNLADAEQVVRRFVTLNYGNLVSVGSPKFDRGTRTWHAELRSTYPRIIRDEKVSSESATVRMLELKDLGEIDLDEGLAIREYTPRDNVIRSLESRISMLRQRAENIVVQASSDVLPGIAETTHVLNPFKLIIDNLLSPPGESVKITHEMIEAHDKPERLVQYLGLMEELGLVKRVEDEYTYGNVFAALDERVRHNRRELTTAVLSYVINKRYSTLRYGFNITQFETYVHSDNCYYWPSIDAEKLVHARRATPYERYLDNYGRISLISFTSILNDLTEEGAIEQDEQGYCYGNHELFDRMLEIKQGYSELNPPTA